MKRQVYTFPSAVCLKKTKKLSIRFFFFFFGWSLLLLRCCISKCSLNSKIQLMRSLVTSIFLYACESWTLSCPLRVIAVVLCSTTGTVVTVMSRLSFWYLFLHLLSMDTGLMTRFVHLTTVFWLWQVVILGQPCTCSATRISADRRFPASAARPG